MMHQKSAFKLPWDSSSSFFKHQCCFWLQYLSCALQIFSENCFKWHLLVHWVFYVSAWHYYICVFTQCIIYEDTHRYETFLWMEIKRKNIAWRRGPLLTDFIAKNKILWFCLFWFVTKFMFMGFKKFYQKKKIFNRFIVFISCPHFLGGEMDFGALCVGQANNDRDSSRLI